MQAALFGHAFAQYDIGTAAGHVGGDGNLPGLAGIRYDHGFFFMILGV